MTDRNTEASYKEDLKLLEELSSYLEYGDTGTALQIIETWHNDLSDDLMTLEDNTKLFEEDATAYYRKGVNDTLNSIINH